MTKRERHAAIVRLVRARRIPSQEALRDLLGREGFDVAQATLSRDLRALGVVKRADPRHGAYYAVPADPAGQGPALAALLPTLYVGADGVEHLVILKTVPGGAQPLAAGIDRDALPDVVGTIAGDDTVLVITRTPEAGARLRRRIEVLSDSPPA